MTGDGCRGETSSCQPEPSYWGGWGKFPTHAHGDTLGSRSTGPAEVGGGRRGRGGRQAQHPAQGPWLGFGQPSRAGACGRSGDRSGHVCALGPLGVFEQPQENACVSVSADSPPPLPTLHVHGMLFGKSRTVSSALTAVEVVRVDETNGAMGLARRARQVRCRVWMVETARAGAPPTVHSPGTPEQHSPGPMVRTHSFSPAVAAGMRV